MSLTEEQKRYRNNFIMLTMLAVVGIMIGIFLYEYTDFFAALGNDNITLNTEEYNFKNVISLFYEELKPLTFLFLAGFTLFSPLVSSLVIIYKGFLCGFSALYFGMKYQNGNFSKGEFMFFAALLILTLVVYIISSAKATTFSQTLKYTAPHMIDLLKQRFTKRYILTFLITAVFIAAISVLKYSVPFIN